MKLDKYPTMLAQACILPQRRTKGGQWMALRCLLLLLLAAPAFAQTTTTTLGPGCVPAPNAPLPAAAAEDGDWLEVMQYAAKYRFNVAYPVVTIRCADGMVLGMIASTRPYKPAAYFSYDPTGPTLQRTTFDYWKNAHTAMHVTAGSAQRLRMNADGTLRSSVYLHLDGRKIRGSL
jgi:hypothetical protein